MIRADPADLVGDASWAVLREALIASSEAHWTEERSRRAFEAVMAKLERRRRRRRIFKYAALVSAILAGVGVLVARGHRL